MSKPRMCVEGTALSDALDVLDGLALAGTTGEPTRERWSAHLDACAACTRVWLEGVSFDVSAGRNANWSRFRAAGGGR